MKRCYNSPEFGVIKLTLTDSVLNISEGESGASGGGYIDPGEEEQE